MPKLPPIASLFLWLAVAAPVIAQGHPAMRMENLDRGVVAVRTGNSSAYIGWRLFGTDSSAVSFNLYRIAGGGSPVRLNAQPIADSTNFRDTSFDGSATNAYFVRPVLGGVEDAPSETFVVPADTPVRQFLPIPLQVPPGGTTPAGEAYSYSANDISVGDLDGDGAYEFIVKWDPSNAKDNAQSGYTGNVYLDAYKLDGTRLWRIDLGRNIRAGAHYTQFIVYDLDSDGRAELAVKTAPGSLDGLGTPVLLPGHSADADYRNSNGYILSGPEYLTVFDGLTGAALATTPYLVPRHPTTENPSSSQLNSVWGDGYGNRVDRFNAAVAYLDGHRPSLIMARGIYTRIAIAAWDWRDGKLEQRWLFDTRGNPALADYAGQGNHQISIADVDDDGRHEIVYGAMTVDDDGSGLYSSKLGHGDTLHVGDFDPARPGLEIFSPFESAGSNGNIGTAMRDARTGAILWSTHATGDVGRGVTMDIDPRHPGTESWATNNSNIYSATGGIIATKPSNMFHNFGVWWDGDLLRELLDGGTVSKWNYNTSGRSNIFLPWQHGATSNNGSKSTPGLSGDILGDWREEIVYRNADSTQLLVFTTTTLTSHRLYTFLHDPQYRIALAWQNVAYNQPPHPSFFVGEGMDPPPAPNIRIDPVAPPRAAATLRWTGGTSASWDVVTAGNWVRQDDGGAESFRNGDAVRFDDNSARKNLEIPAPVAPGEIVMDAAADHVLGGAPISGPASLTKSGTGELRIDQGNTFTGGTTLAGGTISLGTSTSLGTGPVTLAGGTLATGGLAPPNDFVVTADSTITGGHSGGLHAIFDVSGSHTLTLLATNVFDLEGNLGGFDGRIVLGGSGSFRFYGSPGSAATAFDLGTRSLAVRSGASIALGSLAGAPGSILNGATGGGNNTAVTYTIGARGEHTTFAGTITNGNNTAAIVKTGPGRLTLAGNSTYTGATTVAEGALFVTGSLGSTNVAVRPDGAFGGTGAVAGNLSMQSGARLLFGVGAEGVAGVSVAGTVELAGTIHVSPVMLGGELSPGTHTILSRTSGVPTGSPEFVWASPADSPLDASFEIVGGEVRLILEPPPSRFRQWTLELLGEDPSAAPEADADSDGLPNLLEYAFGTDPLVAGPSPLEVSASAGLLGLRFPMIDDSTLEYVVEASPDLESWSPAWSGFGETGAAELGHPAVQWPDGTRFLRLRVISPP